MEVHTYICNNCSAKASPTEFKLGWIEVKAHLLSNPLLMVGQEMVREKKTFHFCKVACMLAEFQPAKASAVAAE